MRIALFGGTFDPIHSGHLRAARAAARRFRLDRILFVPTGNPPHKIHDRLTPFPHRFAMVVLACAKERRFIPSSLEAPRPGGHPHYSIATVRAVKKSLRARDRLYFLIGVDAFLDLPHWKDYWKLLDLVDFIVVSRPGFDSRAIRNVLPREFTPPGRTNVPADRIRLRRSTLFILRGVNAPFASRAIREAIRAGKPLSGLVPPLVKEYILKEGVYRPSKSGRKPS